MAVSPRPRWFMFLSGFGLAGSVLGAVVAAFALASAVVAFSVWPAEPESVELSPLTVGSAERAQPSGARDAPLVLPPPDSAPPAGAAAPAGSSAAGSGRAAQPRRGRQSAGADGAPGYTAGAPDTGDVAGRPTDTAPEPAPGTSADEPPLGKVGGAVDDTTRSLGRGVRSATEDLGKGVKPLSPELAAIVVKTGAALATSVQDLGTAIAALLGHAKPAPPPS